MHASLGCSLPHTTKKTKTKTRDRNRNRADAADAVASRACTGSGQRQAERNSTQWAFVIMCKIHHTSLACLPASQPANFCAATSGARLQFDGGFRLRPTCVRIYATVTLELILFHRSTKSKKPVVYSVASAATLSSLPACAACVSHA